MYSKVWGRALPAVVAVLMSSAGCALPLSTDGRARPARSPISSPAAGPSGYPTTGRPTRIAINHDEFDADHVGHTADGRQFFLTTPFDPGTEAGNDRRDFVALYLFTADGRFLQAEIDEFAGDDRATSAAYEKASRDRLAELGRVRFDRIEVQPFQVDRFGLTFGLVTTPPAGSDDIWWVTVEPGDYMAFAPPWDLGEYDT